MAVYNYSGYDDADVVWDGGTPTAGDTITFTQPTNLTVSISDGDTSLQDGTDDRDDEDADQIATITDEFGTQIDSGQVQPREAITLSDGTNTYVMHRVFIAATGNYYYIFEEPAPSLNTTYTVTGVTTPNSTAYSSLSQTGVPCFAAGTHILTPRGPVPIETLRPGDLVTTHDHGCQPVRWVGGHRVSAQDMRLHARLRPIRIAAGAFGPGLPARDLFLSRQHRVALRTAPGGTDLDALAAVHTLCDGIAVQPALPAFGIAYLHLYFDRHQILMAEGLPVESLLHTPRSAALLRSQGIRPTQDAACPARPILSNQAARQLVHDRPLRALMAANFAMRTMPHAI